MWENAEATRNYLVSEPNYHTFFFSKCLLAIEMKTFMNTNTDIHIIPAYLGQSILEISKIVMYEIWYDYVKPKYGEKAKLS